MKKFFPYIAGIAIAIVCFGFLGTGRALAWDFNILPSAGELVFELLAYLGELCLKLASYVLYIAGGILDFSINASIVNFKKYIGMEGVNAGWVVCRDVANLFFIFILLYISIATILRLQGYGMKQLLVKVVLVALLVNFSGLTTKMIIDATNIFALEFYNNIQGQDVRGDRIGVDRVFVSGLKLSSIYKDYSKSLDAPASQMSFTGVIVGTFGGVILILIASFILFAFAFMFIARTVALLFIYIFSPLAFLAMALPKTQAYASQWWKKLFEQAIFAPVCMFMIYLVAKIISSNGLWNAVGGTGDSGLMDSFFKSAGQDLSIGANVLVYYFILAGLMLGSLKIATSMSAYGAKGFKEWSDKKVAMAGSWAKGLPQRGARRALGGVGEAFATGEGKGVVSRSAAAFGRGVRRAGDSPLKYVGAGAVANLATKGAANLSLANKSRIAEIQKGYEKYSDNQLRNMIPSNASPFARTAVMQELAKRGKIYPARDKGGNLIPGVGNVTDEQILKTKNVLERYGIGLKDFDKLRPDLIRDSNEEEQNKKRADAIKSISVADMEKMDKTVLKNILADEKMKEAALKSWSAAHYEKMNSEVVTDILEDGKNVETMINNFGGKDIKKVLDMGGQMEKKVMEQLSKMAGGERSVDDVIKKLREAGNKSLAGELETGPSRGYLKNYIEGGSSSGKKEKPPERFL